MTNIELQERLKRFSDDAKVKLILSVSFELKQISIELQIFDSKVWRPIMNFTSSNVESFKAND